MYISPDMSASKRVKIITYGCQMNVYDTQHMLHNLAQYGYAETDAEADADLIILNTCSVRENPAQKTFSKLGRLRRHKAQNPDLLLVVAGCVAQQEQEALARRVPYLDIVMGPDQVGEIGELVERRRRDGRQVVATRFQDEADRIFAATPVQDTGRVSAFVTVMKGCNQFCSYCIVPYTRGRETSRSPASIEAEVKALVAAGIREVTLLGQNVNRYGLDQSGLPDFAALLERLNEVEGLARIRFITSHPADCTDRLIDCFARLDRLPHYFHLPLQSGSDRILKAMNRRYSMAHYLDRVDRLRAIDPLFHISTDLIVGFPGETDADFEATIEAAHRVQWGSAYSFKYSPRPGTRAAKRPDDVPAAVKQQRLAALQDVLRQTMQSNMAAHVGRRVEVLVEGASVRSTGQRPQLTGRTGTNYIVNFERPAGRPVAPGDLIPVSISQSRAHSLMGEVAEEDMLWPSK